MESKGPGTQVQGRKSVLFWADYIQTEYYQQDYDADLCNLSACNFYVYAAPILVGWASGYLDIRSMYDVQISSRYNDVYDEENLPDDNYELVTDFLSEHGIETDYDCTFSLYLPSKDDFHTG